MMLKKIPSLLKAFLLAVVLWVIFIICDAIDELVLDVDSFFGYWACIIVPLVLVILYIINFYCNKTPMKQLAQFNGIYLVSATCLSLAISYLVMDDLFPVTQQIRNIMSFNGLEYSFYSITIVIGTSILVALFHIFAAIQKAVLKK